MRIPTITLALVAAALSGSALARLAKSPKAAAGPAYLAGDSAGHAVAPDARADVEKRQLTIPDVVSTVTDALAAAEDSVDSAVAPLLPPPATGSDQDSGNA
ncbi:hypothetical protein GSI_09826 [Ganoderma sinense ZZ0214-1]|uniref:Transporter n=1 Tax=Ganoderma sinense ZZ0214-1 TaxID=1077348 RepID=A0A2G8S2R5_9APHY|nr:hypothetical protein GSI_09826 [Ganoderma sinense ZZ0214-1]